MVNLQSETWYTTTFCNLIYKEVCRKELFFAVHTHLLTCFCRESIISLLFLLSWESFVERYSLMPLKYISPANWTCSWQMHQVLCATVQLRLWPASCTCTGVCIIMVTTNQIEYWCECLTIFPRNTKPRIAPTTSSMMMITTQKIYCSSGMKNTIHAIKHRIITAAQLHYLWATRALSTPYSNYFVWHFHARGWELEAG